ncbi:LAQU0S14e00254g1_1 [Lachancea quebecensis]|uniref:Pre-mRNA-splicing factor SYF1 n=1 Tax=Lachancea quebecensis TaxID=1654605 RepID=A0A0P1KW17_9SACH|nr:LAQU0S14e00254g1_1 [Lachancea quebecensis]
MDTGSVTRFVTSKEDIAYEYELQSDGDNLVVWRRYLEHKKTQENDSALAWVYERCCFQFPGSTEMWLEYMMWRVSLLSGANSVLYAEEFEKCNQLFEKAMYLCYQSVELWELYLRHVVEQRNLHLIRVLLNKALRHLHMEYHIRVWDIVIEFIENAVLDPQVALEAEEDIDALVNESLFNPMDQSGVADVWSSHILSRYIQVAEDLEHALYLLGLTQDHPEIAKAYRKYIIDMPFSPAVHTAYEFHCTYLRSLEKSSSHSEYTQAMAQCMEMFPEQKSSLIIQLAKYYIGKADLFTARSTLLDALASTVTSKSFSEIYDFLVKLLEAFASSSIQQAQKNTESENHQQLESDLAYNMDLLEYLLESHSLLLNDLKLRQNVNDVGTWLERADLFSSPAEKVNVYTDAITKIDHLKTTIPGSFGQLWCCLAQLYTTSGKLDAARETYDRGLRVPYKSLSDLENIWCAWAEMELECGRIQASIKLLREALKVPKSAGLVVDAYNTGNSSVPAKAITFISQRLWTLYIDLLESTCESPAGIEETVRAYEQLIALKLATPLNFINYSHFLQEQGQWDESFKIYERAITIFPGQARFDIWSLYLQQSLDRKRPAETMRDLFEQALKVVEEDVDCPSLFILCSDFEHSCGLEKRSIDVLLRGCRECKSLSAKVALWKACLSFSKERLGAESSRPLYEECIKTLPNSRATSFALEFAETEAILGDYDRVRAILRFGAGLIHPDRNAQLWNYWSEFELKHGDKSTYKEMLKMKRELASTMKVSTEAVSQKDGNIAFVASNTEPKNPGTPPVTTEIAENPEEIVLDI